MNEVPDSTRIATLKYKVVQATNRSGSGSFGGTIGFRSNQAIVRDKNEPGNAKVGDRG